MQADRTHTATSAASAERKLKKIAARKPRHNDGTPDELVQPYKRQSGYKTYTWIKPNSFQLLCAGLDGVFGDTTETLSPETAPVYPRGENYGVGQWDNLANFSTGTLEADK